MKPLRPTKPLLTLFTLITLLTLLSPSVFAYPDVHTSYSNHKAITYLSDNEIVKGYADGKFRPENLINRAEFLKIIIEGVIGTPSEPTRDCFPDVKVGEWYTKYICKAKELGVIKGYPDGNYRPANNINLVEALKIFVEAYNIPTQTAEPWYAPYINVMSESRYIPGSFSTFDQQVKRGEMSEIIWRVLEDVKDESYVTAENLQETNCYQIGDDVSSSIDMDQVRQAWLNTLNAERIKEGLHAYTLNDHLNRTATEWAQATRDKGYIDHKRPGITAYYDYNSIRDWFSDRGLVFKNVYRVTFSENIGAGSFSCSSSDCTSHVIANMQPTFNMYMAEKDKSYKPHYSSVMNGYFNEIGVGIAISGSKMYITTHYGTEIISNPLPICTVSSTNNTNDNGFGNYGYYRPN